MRYFLKKLGAMIVTLFVISLLAFLAFQVIPGDPTSKLLGGEYTPERAAALREALGLSGNVFLRYFKWLGAFVSGDFGTSYSYSMPVSELLDGKILTTALLSLLSFFMVVLFSIPAGFLAARYGGGAFDRVMMVTNQLVMAIPPFFIGIVFTIVFGLSLNLFVAGRFVHIGEDFWEFWRCIVFPALSIALPKAAMTAKLLRSSILSELGSDYVRTAESRGSSRWQTLRRHVLRNAIIPVVTFLAVSIADIVAGSIIIEQVFSIPGLGRLLISSISNRDFPVVQAIVVLISAIVVFVNFAADIAYQCIDPRIRLR